MVQDMADQISQLPKMVASTAANVAENAKNSGFKDKFIEQKDKFFNKITDLTYKFKK